MTLSLTYTHALCQLREKIATFVPEQQFQDDDQLERDLTMIDILIIRGYKSDSLLAVKGIANYLQQ